VAERPVALPPEERKGAMTDSDRCRQHSRAEYYRRRGIEAQQRAARATEPKIKDAFEDVRAVGLCLPNRWNGWRATAHTPNESLSRTRFQDNGRRLPSRHGRRTSRTGRTLLAFHGACVWQGGPRVHCIIVVPWEGPGKLGPFSIALPSVKGQQDGCRSTIPKGHL
jgi:hypothetical protein